MFNCADNHHRCRSETFAPFENSHSFGSQSPLGFNQSSQSIVKGVPHTVKELDILSDCLNENLFHGLGNESENNESFFNILNTSSSVVEHDLSDILSGVYLGENCETTEGSDKENEANSLSLADLFYKEKKEHHKNQSSPIPKNEILRNEVLVLNSLESILADCASTDNISQPSVSKVSSEQTYNLYGGESTLSDLFNDILLSEKQDSHTTKKQKTFDANEPLDFLINLNSAKKDAPPTGTSNLTSCLPRETKREKRRKLPKTKPSLFCKVLCSKPKLFNIENIPKLPKDLPELLSDIGYWTYFSFDTPSPDDIVKQKQRTAFKKH